jgi:glycosyltransferase involved in cell wall biosynthesis
MKISIISFDLGNNCLGRAYLLGKVLSRHYDVDIHGFVFPYSGNKIWKPCDTGEFYYKVIQGRNFPFFLKSMTDMYRSINGDVIYASKATLPSYVVALLKKFFSDKPVVLDIDDLETAWFEKLKGARRWMRILQPYGPIHTTWIENFIGFADEITTVSTQLREKFGRGVIIPHGKDTEHFDPAKYDRNKLRKELQFDGYKIIMFLGTVRPHKGLEHIIQALNLLNRDDIRLMIIGAGTEPKYENMLEEIGNGKVILKEKIPFNNIPQYLHAADIVVLPQKKTIQSYGQIPAKLFDAMAMAKPIIAADVSDLQMILNGCGIIVEPEDISGLADKIDWVCSNTLEAEKMGRRAREKCIADYSWDVMEEKLVAIFEKYK